MTMEEVNKWVSTAKKGEKIMYYRGAFAEEALHNFEMRKFSKDLLDFEKKSNPFPFLSIVLYQKKIKAGDENVQPIYEYYIKKN